MLLELELAWRFLRRRKGPLLRGTGLAAFAGIALATAALVITLALMNGYTLSISTALQSGNAHMVGFSPQPLSLAEADELASRLRDVDGVVFASPLVYLNVLIDDPNEPSNPIPVVIKAVKDPPSFTGLIEWPEVDVLPAVLGQRLAANLGVKNGDIVSVKLPPAGRSWILPSMRLKVVGTFSLAFSEFDAQWVVAPLEEVLQTMPRIGVAGIEMELQNAMAVETMSNAVEMVAPELFITDWREMNGALFAALKWQTISLFVVLSLVVAVASFQVSSALVVMAIEKRRTSGMLQALGATRGSIRRILVLSGSLLGGAGVAAGMIFGWAASMLMSAFRVIRFPEGLARVYMVDSIPFVVSGAHLCAVALVCLFLVVSASFWPAWRSSRLDPVQALRSV